MILVLAMFWGVLSGKGNKSKNKQAGPHQTKELSNGEGNHQQNERQTTEWEKIFANDISDKGWTFKTYKEFTQLNI